MKRLAKPETRSGVEKQNGSILAICEMDFLKTGGLETDGSSGKELDFLEKS